jgi:hypothetical protein
MSESFNVGNNFGLNNQYDYYEFQFDSKDTINTLNPPNQDPQLQQYNALNWPLFTMGRPTNAIAAMKVIEVQIPFSYYVIQALNNSFTLLEQQTSPGPPAVYAFTIKATIPVGSYTALTLATALQTELNAITTYTASGTTNPYTVTYNSTTKKYEVRLSTTVNQTFALEFGTAFDPGFQNPRYVLGMAAGDNVGIAYTPTSTPGAFNFHVISPLVAQVTGPNYLFLNSSLMGQQCNLYLPDGAWNRGQIGPQIAKIPVNVNPGGIIFWQNPDPQKWFNLENSNNINNIDFYCTLGNEPTKIDFNGVSFSFTLGILYNREAQTTQLRGMTSENRVFKRVRG